MENNSYPIILKLLITLVWTVNSKFDNERL